MSPGRALLLLSLPLVLSLPSCKREERRQREADIAAFEAHARGEDKLPQHLQQTQIDPELGYDLTAMWENRDTDGDPAHHGEPWDWPFQPADDAPDGPYREAFADGTPRITGELKDGKPVGTWREYDETGQKRRFGQYLDGEQHGLWRAWYPNGARRAQGQYWRDAPRGVFHEYHPSDRLWQKYGYDGDGFLHGPWLMWDDAGLGTEMGSYFHSQPDGPWWIWWETRELREEVVFIRGEEHGTFREWDREGRPLAAGAYEMGRPVAPWTCWDADGTEHALPVPDGERRIPSVRCYEALGDERYRIEVSDHH